MALSLDLVGRAHRLGDDIIADEAQRDQRRERVVLVVPVAYGAPFRERIAGHGVAGMQGLFGLIVQRLANILDRIDEVQAVRQHLQVGLFRGQRGRRRRCELRQIEQRTGVRRADRPGWAKAAMRPPLQARRR